MIPTTTSCTQNCHCSRVAQCSLSMSTSNVPMTNDTKLQATFKKKCDIPSFTTTYTKKEKCIPI